MIAPLACMIVLSMAALSESSVLHLEQNLGCDWPTIDEARLCSRKALGDLQKLLGGLDTEDTSIVVFGSLARGEFTSGSDLDWTFLIDGLANPRHLDVAQEIERRLEAAKHRKPGRTGVFGNMAFSHEIIHEIGGQDDTNRNLTRRILLLLESVAVGKQEAYDRVIRNVLERYLSEDRGLWFGSARYRVPRFLLNDIVRLWRTMAVDFAHKQRERGDREWALRNAKLRMSRKLIFAAGLLTCFSCHYAISARERDLIFASKPNPAPLVNHLSDLIRTTPLEILAGALLPHRELDGTARKLFDAYEDFLALLSNEDTRKRLEDLPYKELEDDQTFQKVRSIGHRFQDGLNDLFLDQRSYLYGLTKIYGVF